MTDDSDRAAILARRNRLIALALGGITSIASCDEAYPSPCLEPPLVEEGSRGPEPEPAPCLSVIAPDQPDETGADETTTDEPAPIPCLEVAAPEDPRPARTPREAASRPCLSAPAPPVGSDDDDRFP